MRIAAHSHLTKFCRQCGRLLPATSFRRRSRASELRHSQCTSCHAEAERRRAFARRYRAVGECVRKIGSIRADSRRVGALTKILAIQFGGVEGLASELVSWYRQMALRGDTSGQFRFFSLVVRLLEVCEDQKSAIDDGASPVDLTDNQLDALIADQFLTVGRKP